MHRTGSLKHVLRPGASVVDKMTSKKNKVIYVTWHKKFLKTQYFNYSHKLKEIGKQHGTGISPRKERNSVRNSLKSSESIHAA